MTTVIRSGVRQVKGAMPPFDDPTQFKLFWRMCTDNTVIFFMQKWSKDYKRWIPVVFDIRIVVGGARVPVNKFDFGKDIMHKVVVYRQEQPLEIMLDVYDHRSFQKFTHAQLSNFEGENTEENVEEGSNGI